MSRERLERFQLAAVLFVLAAPLVLLLILRRNPSLDREFNVPREHFYVVSAAALAALILAVLVGVASVRSRQPRTFFMATAFLAVAGFFSVHGLSTPGLLIDDLHLSISVNARFSLLAGGLLFALSAIESPAAVRQFITRHHGRLVAGAVILTVAYIGANLAFPAWLDFLAADAPAQAAAGYGEASGSYGEYGAYAVNAHAEGHAALIEPAWLTHGSAIVATGLLLFAAWRYYRVFALSRLPAVAAVSIGLVLLAESQASMSLGQTWRLSWWAYHVLILVGLLLPIAGIGLAFASGRSFASIVEGFFLRDTLTKLEHAFPEAVSALTAAIEAKDPYLKGHAHRVCELAVQVGTEMRLSDARLRTIANAALLHDIGKIGIPDAILQKPGRLTDEEYAILKEHSSRGEHIIAQIPSLRAAAPAIRYHHERVDGTGYPDGLCGDAIPLEARVLAVADVWDALTSDRIYRRAWLPAAAREKLRQDAGVGFDPHCITALFAVLDRTAPAPTPNQAPVSSKGTTALLPG